LRLPPGAYDCWMAERGRMSFHLRSDRAEENAATLAGYISTWPGAEVVLTPGHPDHPAHNRAGGLLAG